MASDGFVSSAHNGTPTATKLGTQYGNANAAAQEGEAAVQRAPSGTTTSIPPEYMPIVDTFNTINAQIAQIQLNAGEKRQFKDIQKATVLMSDKLNNQEIDANTCAAMLEMIGALNNGDFNTASQIHIGLTQTAWSQHKDWLKGVKFLVQLCKNKFGAR